MPKAGTLSHIDISVGSSERSIRFYDTLLTGLGYKRWYPDHPEFSGDKPLRATWSIRYRDGGYFGIEVRPAHDSKKGRRYDRYEPGPHHLAFHADNAQQVDHIHSQMASIGADILDPPADYSGEQGYSDGYYAAFYADPDGVKLEVVHLP